MKYIKNEKGVTLVEVLAAVVILTIIMGSIMNFFPQIATVNKENGDKSQAINTARYVLNKWQNDVDIRNYLTSEGKVTLPSTIKLISENPNNQDYHLQSNEGNFNLDVYISKCPDLPNNVFKISDPKCSNPSSYDSKVTKAYRTKIQISNKKVTTDTYGYIYSE